MATTQSRQKLRGPCRFPGITADARTLGVSRNWLYSVLSGRYQCAELLARYAALQGAPSSANAVTESNAPCA